MTKPVLPSGGGSFIREKDGSLKRWDAEKHMPDAAKKPAPDPDPKPASKPPASKPKET